MTQSHWLVVGLGNPGQKYESTPHNIGWLVVEELASRMGASFGRARKAKALVADGHLDGQRSTLVKPLSFMNLSGEPVAALMAYQKIPLERLVVVHDEIDLPFGALRLKSGGGDNGHNGLKSLRQRLGSGEYTRVRIGVDRPTGPIAPADYLLRPFPAARRKEVPDVVTRAADAVEAVLGNGLAKAQNQYNG